MCVRCGTGRIAMCTDPNRHEDGQPKGMTIEGAVVTVPASGMLHITLADGRYLNLTPDGTIIVEAGGSDGFGEYTLTLPPMAEIAQCGNPSMRHGDFIPVLHHR
jgi:hypothetical protein